MHTSFSGLVAASDDDPLLQVDRRKRLSLGKLAAHRRYLVIADEGQLLLTPCKVSTGGSRSGPEQDPRVPSLADQWLRELRGQGSVELAEVDKRNRISLGALAGRLGAALGEWYTATVQPQTCQILLTPTTIVPVHAERMLEQLLERAKDGEVTRRKRARPQRKE